MLSSPVATSGPGHWHGVPVWADALSRLPLGLALPGDQVREARPAAPGHLAWGSKQQLLGDKTVSNLLLMGLSFVWFQTAMFDGDVNLSCTMTFLSSLGKYSIYVGKK